VQGIALRRASASSREGLDLSEFFLSLHYTSDNSLDMSVFKYISGYVGDKSRA